MSSVNLVIKNSQGQQKILTAPVNYNNKDSAQSEQKCLQAALKAVKEQANIALSEMVMEEKKTQEDRKQNSQHRTEGMNIFIYRLDHNR